MDSRCDVVVHCLLAAALLTAAATVAPADTQGDPPSWCAYMGPARSVPGAAGAESTVLLPRVAGYDVDLLGNLAYGNLVLEFANASDVDLEMKFFARPAPGLRMLDMGIALDESEEPEPLKFEEARSGGANTTRGRPARSSDAGQKGLGSDNVHLAAEESVWVQIGFTQTLGFRDGSYRLQLPVVGGSCIPGASEAGPAAPLDVTLRVHHEEPLEVAASPSHEVLVEFEGDYTVAELVAPDTLGQVAFQFDYALGASNEPALSSFVTPESADGERDVLVLLAPSIAPSDETVRLKEILFVLDTSGSMNGPKLDSARGALVACLEQLADQDRFNLVQFDGKFTMLFQEPQEASSDALGNSVAWLQAQRAGGSTTLLPALDATLKQSRSQDHHRQVVVLTDGAIGDATQVQEYLRDRLGEARLFFVGVGADQSREKVLKLAEWARGTAVFADDPAGFATAVGELFAGISSPLAWDLRVDWGEAQVLEVEPRRLPDLYKGRPVAVKARVKGELPATLVLEATTTGGVRTFETVLPAGGAREFPQVRALRSKNEPTAKRKTGR